MEHCRDECCWAWRPIDWAYSGAKGRRPTIRDRLSPGDLRTIIDVHHDIDGGPRPDWVNITYLTPQLLPCLQPGTVVMVEGWQKKSFTEQVGGVGGGVHVCVGWMGARTGWAGGPLPHQCARLPAHPRTRTHTHPLHPPAHPVHASDPAQDQGAHHPGERRWR